MGGGAEFEDQGESGPLGCKLSTAQKGSLHPYFPWPVAGCPEGKTVTPQVTQMDTSRTLLDDADLSTQLYHCLCGMLLGAPLTTATRAMTLPQAPLGRHRSLTCGRARTRANPCNPHERVGLGGYLGSQLTHLGLLGLWGGVQLNYLCCL